jgi:large subunit ribosomal protein L31
MKDVTHPKYEESIVSCACGYIFKTRSTKPFIRLEICSNCHPFFTGKQKLIDIAGRVEKFQRRFAKTDGKTVVTKKTKRIIPILRKTSIKVLSTPFRKTKTITEQDKKAKVKATVS